MNISSELKLRNVSINECSKKTGIPYGALYPIVQGKVNLQNCKYSTLSKLSEFFTCTVDDLLFDFNDFSVYWENEKTADVIFDENSIKVIRYTQNPIKQLFYKENLSRYELGEILKWRCWDSKRENIEKYLFALGLSEFDPYKICRKTHGTMVQDKIWFKFKEEDLNWEKVKCN